MIDQELKNVSRETGEKLSAYVDMLLAENSNQNLISKASEDVVWERHIADSAQLVSLAGRGCWADIGSGPGLPGMVVAILTGDPMTLIEPRPLRTEFLRRVAADLDLSNVSVITGKAQSVKGAYDVITARAVAKANEFLRMTAHLSHAGTTYLLMKGRTAQSELDELRRGWQGDFRLVPSRTDPEAGIIVGTGVKRGGR